MFCDKGNTAHTESQQQYISLDRGMKVVYCETVFVVSVVEGTSLADRGL